MNHNSHIPQKFNWRLFSFLSLGIVIGLAGLIFYRVLIDTPPPLPKSGSTSIFQFPSSNKVDIEVVQKKAWKRIEVRLDEADGETRKLTNQLVKRIDSFFNERKERTDAFAESALGWRSKWELIKSRTGHRTFIANQFSQYIFSQKELATLLQEATEEYAQGAKAIENKLLVTVRADLDDLPADVLPAFVNDQILKSKYDKVLANVVVEVARDLQIDIGREVGSLVIGELVAVVITKTLTTIATRLGISAGVLGTGAATSWATLGAGIAIAIAVDFVLDWVIGWFHNPVKDISNKVSASLDDVKNSIITGDAEAWKDYNKLKLMIKNDSSSAVRNRASEATITIERSGALGLKHVMGRLAEVQSKSRNMALHQLVYGE